MAINPRDLKISDYDYPLPDNRIAKHPLAQRDKCLLLVRGSDGTLEDHLFDELPTLLPADAMLVYNDTRVINARLRMRKHADKGEGALIEIFCLEPCTPADYARNFASTQRCSWHCLIGNSKRWKEGALTMMVEIDGKPVTLSALRLERDVSGASVVEFSWDGGVEFARVIEAAGEIPIPPYLNRSTQESDSADYQTVFARVEGSVAAPTAGLHFTPGVLAEIDARGIARRNLTLHVGAGTFRPVKSDTVGEHDMHSEWIAVDRDLIAELASTQRRVIAVGTTSVRTLESLYHAGVAALDGNFNGEVGQWVPYSDRKQWPSREQALSALVDWLDSRGLLKLIAATRIIIAPGYRFRVVEGMVTNFHQPQSTLLLLVSAFTNGDWRALYRHALDGHYRFLSYGDAQLLL